MSLRSYEELQAAVRLASQANDAVSLKLCIDELSEIGTPEAMALREGTLGIVDHYQGHYDSALTHFDHALTLYEALGDRSGAAGVHANIGLVHYQTGKFSRSLEYYQRAIALYEECGERAVMGGILGNIGNIYAVTGDYVRSLEAYHRATALHTEFDQRNGIASVTCNIGNLHKFTGNYPMALEFYHRALDAFEQLGNQRFLANVLLNMGGLYDLLGEAEQALPYLHRSHDVYTQINDRNGIASSLGNIGLVTSRTGDTATALEHLRRAAALLRELGDPRSLAHCLGNTITVLIDDEQWDEAAALFSELESLHATEPQLQIIAEQIRSRFQLREGAIDRAIEALKSALPIATSHTIPMDAATLHRHLRDLAMTRNDLAAYVEHNNEYARITEEINGKETTSKLAMQDAERRIAAERIEHEKQLAVLHSTLPKHIADRVARGETVTDQFDEAAVLFLDVAGFTTNTSALDATAVVDLLQQIFTAFDAICAMHDVMKIKTIGDSYMAVAFPSDASSAVINIANIAVAMLESPFTWPHTKQPVAFRIGIHLGPVVAGVIGTERLQYDVWGDTVNVASRMESHGEPGRIHVSEAFASALDPGLRRGDDDVLTAHSPPLTDNDSLTPDSLTLQVRGVVSIKGKGPMTTYWLERA
jgi:class 3 adenylate cyclase/tetratricopeptide (TPR) repeat protein